MSQPSLFDQQGFIDLGTLPGASEPHIIVWLRQGHYVAKQYDPRKPWTLVSEWLCADIASLMGLPIPSRRIIPFNGNQLGFELRSEAKSFQPGMERNIINVEVIAGMIAFDVWICNRDRHGGNVLLQRPSDGMQRYTLSLIDHSHALIGDLPSLDALHRFIQQNNDPRCFIARMPQQLRSVICNLEDYEPWITKVESFDMSQLDERVQAIPVEWIPDWGQLDSLIKFVAQRASNVKSMIMDNPQLFTSQVGQGG